MICYLNNVCSSKPHNPSPIFGQNRSLKTNLRLTRASLSLCMLGTTSSRGSIFVPSIFFRVKMRAIAHMGALCKGWFIAACPRLKMLISLHQWWFHSIQSSDVGEKVPLWRKLTYAVGSIPYSMITSILGFYFSVFLLEVVIVSHYLSVEPLVCNVLTFRPHYCIISSQLSRTLEIGVS